VSQVYLSFHPKDSVLAKMIIEKLGSDVAYVEGRMSGSTEWDAAADLSLQAAPVVVTVMSPHARSADFVAYEWATALAMGKQVIPVILRKVDLHPRLAGLNIIDFTSGPDWDALLSLVSSTPDFIPSTPESVEPQPTEMPSELSPDAPQTVREAYEALNTFEPEARAIAIQTLVRLDHPAAADALALAGQHPSREIRWEAAMALGNKHDKRAIPGLLEIMSSRNEQETWDAAWALVGMGAVEAADDLIAEMRKETSMAIRSSTWALGQFGLPIKDKLISVLGDDNQNVRLGAVEALTEVGAPAVPDLVDALPTASDLKAEMIIRILKAHSEEAIPPLSAGLRQGGEMRRAAGRALIEIGDPAVPALADALRDPDQRVMRGAGQILQRIGTPGAIQAIEQWQQEND